MPKFRTPVLKAAGGMVVALCIVLITPILTGQTSDPQALTLAAQAMQALNHGLPVSDVTLTGTVTQTAGSWHSTGPATFKALGAAQAYAKARADFTASGHSEIHTLDTSGQLPQQAPPMTRSVARRRLSTPAGASSTTSILTITS